MEEIEVRYRVYYKQNCKNINFDGFWYSEAYEDVNYARFILNEKKKLDRFIEGHIKQEVTTKMIIE